MIKFENEEVMGWEHAIRGCRNPRNSWQKSDTGWNVAPPEGGVSVATDKDCYELVIGPNDRKLMMQLRNAGTDHRKFMRMIVAYVDITAPLYFMKQLDTYRAGVEKNSCSTMHKIGDKEFTMDDFSHEHLMDELENECTFETYLACMVDWLNEARRKWLETKDKFYWWQMIQLLPSSYNQRRTYMFSYEALANIYKSRKNHKLDEWRDFCKWIKSLPYSELITGKDGSDEEIHAGERIQ